MKEINNKNPLVYIVMPCYNSEKYLLEQLMSIYFQNYTNRYLIFVNDGSTDNSENILRDWISHYNLHDKVKVITKKNGGVTSAVQRGLEEIKNMCDIQNTDSLVSYCDSDDVRTRNKLKIQVEYMINNPECGLSHHDLAKINENGEIIEHSILKGKYRKNRSFLLMGISSAMMVSTAMMFKSKYINYILPMPIGKGMVQDTWTAIILAYKGVINGYINNILGYYRVGHPSIMKAFYSRNLKEKCDKYVNLLKFVKIRYPEADVDRIIKRNEDVRFNFIVNKYGFFHRVFLKIFKYPKYFILEFQLFLYEKIICRFKKKP